MNKQLVLQVLVNARARIASPETWCKWHSARDRNGDFCEYHSDAACSFCSVGAIWAAAHVLRVGPLAPQGLSAHPVDEATTLLAQSVRHVPSVAAFNDAPTTTHADVLKMYDDAIARLRAEGATNASE